MSAEGPSRGTNSAGSAAAEPQAWGDHSRDEQAIRDLVKTWMDASRAGDVQTVLSLMSDDVVFLVPGKEPMRKSEFVAGFKALANVSIDGHSDIQEIRIVGDWAYIWTQLTVVMTPKSGGPLTKRSGYTMSILQKRSGKWQMLRDANLLTEAKP